MFLKQNKNSLGPWRLAPDDGTNTNRCLVASQQGNALAESLSCFAAPLHKCTVYLQRMPNSIATISDAAECIERFRIPFISITTWTLQVLAWLVESGEKQFDLSAAKAVQVSGMSTPGYQMRRFAKLLPSAVIHKVYGSTEVCLVYILCIVDVFRLNQSAQFLGNSRMKNRKGTTPVVFFSKKVPDRTGFVSIPPNPLDIKSQRRTWFEYASPGFFS